MTNIRENAVAGSFYPAEPELLTQMIDDFLQQLPSNNSRPRALIVPHAGYIYSGFTAAYAYKQLLNIKDSIKHVILLGPSHHVSFSGLAVSDADYFSTPLGDIALDKKNISQLLRSDQVTINNQAHQYEHSLEVQLPFLQTILTEFTITPLLVGQATPESISELIEPYFLQPDTLIIISTDLSHFLNYEQAKIQDNQTNQLVINLNYQQLDYHDACGRVPLAGFLYLAKKLSLSIELLDLRSSGDRAGDKNRVVGYGAWSVNAK